MISLRIATIATIALCCAKIYHLHTFHQVQTYDLNFFSPLSTGALPSLAFLTARRVDNALRRINFWHVNNAVSFVNTYPLDGDLSVG